MPLKEQDTKKIIEFVKKEPRTVQEISKFLKRSWVTTNTYLEQIKNQTGLIEIKTFRKGSQAALKLVYYNPIENSLLDELKDHIYAKIKSGRSKSDFDFMDLFQHVDEKSKKVYTEEFDTSIYSEKNLKSLFENAESQIYCFSGNLSFINVLEDDKRALEFIESLIKDKKIKFKILTRVNLASISNFEKISNLIVKYPESLEIKHCYQPLRGFIIDNKIARFKNLEETKTYKQGELNKNTTIYYEIYDKDWINWMQKVFWNLFKSSIDYRDRLKELKKIF